MVKRIFKWWFEAWARQNFEHEHRKRHADLEKRVENLEQFQRDDLKRAELRLRARMQHTAGFAKKFGTVHQLFED